LANKLKELKNNVDRFFEDGIKQIRKDRGEDAQVVFIFNQLEQLRGTLQTEQDVIRSVERIFAIHIDLLKIPYVHTVFTVPPWLKFVLPGTVQITLLSTVRLWNNDTARSRCELAWEASRSLVERRLGKEGLRLLSGKRPAGQKLVDDVIAVCGGLFPRSTAALAGHSGAGDFLTESSRSHYSNCTHDQRRAPRFSTDSPGRRPLACRNCQGARHGAAQHRGHSGEPIGQIPGQPFCLYFVNADEW
jgi:hypothetical protein